MLISWGARYGMEGTVGLSSALAGIGEALDSASSTSALASANSFSSILGTVMRSDLLGQTASSEDAAETIASELAEESAKKLSSLAGAGSDGAFEGEARSNLILQNYLYTAMMKDSLDSSLTDKADFTSGLFSNLAVGSEDSDGSSALKSMTDSALGAIGNYSAYKTMLDSTLGSETAGKLLDISVGDDSSAVSALLSSAVNSSLSGTSAGSALSSAFLNEDDDSDSAVTSYNGQGSLLKEMLSTISNDILNITASDTYFYKIGGNCDHRFLR